MLWVEFNIIGTLGCYFWMHFLQPNLITVVLPGNYNLRRHPEFVSRAINTIHYGSESLSFLGSKTWKMLPIDLTNSDSIDSLKSRIRIRPPEKCPFRLCKRYIHQVGFMQISKWFCLLTLWNLILERG